MKNSSMPSMSDERRKDERHVVLVKVAVRDEQRLRTLYATNLSQGGLFLATRTALPLGQEVRLRLVHPLTQATFEVSAEVANVRRSEEGGVQGCGLKFSTFDEDFKEDLFLFVEGVVDIEEDEEEIEFDVDMESDEPIPEAPSEATPEKAQAYALLLKSLVLENEGNIVGAAHLLARATSIDPTEDALWTALKRVEAKLENEAASLAAPETGATEEFESEKETLPVSDEPLQASSQERESVLELDETSALEPADRRKSRLLFEAARDCYRTQDVDDAINYLEHSIGADPTYAPPHYALAGMLAEERNDVKRSLFLCRKALELDPDNEVYQEALASLEELAKGSA